MTDLDLPIELVLIERSLESEDFDRATKGLEKLRMTPGKQEDPYFYLIDYYWGQILFRKEMGRKRVREKKIDLTIKYLKKSLKASSDFVDAHLLLGLALNRMGLKLLLQSRASNPHIMRDYCAFNLN